VKLTAEQVAWLTAEQVAWLTAAYGEAAFADALVPGPGGDAMQWQPGDWTDAQAEEDP
jgi:hypothetical protein